jgi:hypothetical protein
MHAEVLEQRCEDLEAEIARLRDELASATRHMELAESAWLRETAGNSPVAVTLADAEREAVLAMACHCDTRSGLEWVRLSATLRGLLDRLK